MDRSYSNKCTVIPLVFIFMYGCNFLGFNDDGEVSLETDRDSYLFGSGAVVQMTVTNHYDHAIYYVCTGQIYLEELEEGVVNDKWFVHGFEACLNRIPIEADQSQPFEISFENNSLLDERLKNALFNERVDYRFQMDLYETEEVNQLIDKKDRLSNTFKILQE